MLVGNRTEPENTVKRANNADNNANMGRYKANTALSKANNAQNVAIQLSNSRNRLICSEIGYLVKIKNVDKQGLRLLCSPCGYSKASMAIVGANGAYGSDVWWRAGNE